MKYEELSGRKGRPVQFGRLRLRIVFELERPTQHLHNVQNRRNDILFMPLLTVVVHGREVVPVLIHPEHNSVGPSRVPDGGQRLVDRRDNVRRHRRSVKGETLFGGYLKSGRLNLERFL